MKFSEAMKALEDGEVVKRVSEVDFYAKRGGRAFAWSLYETLGNDKPKAFELCATLVCFDRNDADADDWVIVANPPNAIAEAIADIETGERPADVPSL